MHCRQASKGKHWQRRSGRQARREKPRYCVSKNLFAFLVGRTALVVVVVVQYSHKYITALVSTEHLGTNTYTSISRSRMFHKKVVRSRQTLLISTCNSSSFVQMCFFWRRHSLWNTYTSFRPMHET
jgi:hypothetical protein